MFCENVAFHTLITYASVLCVRHTVNCVIRVITVVTWSYVLISHCHSTSSGSDFIFLMTCYAVLHATNSLSTFLCC